MNTDLLLEAFRRMTRIRIAETLIAKDFIENKIFSFLHLSIGQEAVAVGVSLALKKVDRSLGNHRSHSHYLAKGGDLYRMFCEIYGKADGCCKGYGGSMHMLDRSVNFMGSTPILGSVAAIAAGFAFEQKTRKADEVTVCYLGDGASEEGVVYESINLAAVMKLPIIFVIENNLYAVSSDESVRRSPQFSRGDVCHGLGALFYVTNGNAFMPVYDSACTARRDVLEKQRPAVIEARVFRHMSHSGPLEDDAADYRKIDTKEVRHENDPIMNIMAYLSGKLGAAFLERINDAIITECQDALARAKAAPEPDPQQQLSAALYV